MSFVLRLLRRLATLPGLRRLTEIDALMRLSLSLRSSLVRNPLRFVWNELRPDKKVTATYRLKDSGVAVTIRHKSPDILILDEMFSQHEYAFPAAVTSQLSNVQGRALRVTDIGANIGLFGAWILGHYPGAEIVAVEPEPSNAELHRATIVANGREETWHFLEAAAATAPGKLRFSPGLFATSHVAHGEEDGIEVESVDFFQVAADADLVKLDIEGAEWPILADPRFRELDSEAVVLEYHPEGSPESDPGAAAQRLLAEAGFSVVEHRPSDHPLNVGVGVLWAVRAPS